jgi:hypothetical protein
MLPYVLNLLERKWDRLNVAAALDALPGESTFRDVSNSLAAMSTAMKRRSRSCQLQVWLNVSLQQTCLLHFSR